MANHKSAAKRARQTIKRTERNRVIKAKVRTAIRAFREALAGDDAVKTHDTLAAVTRTLRKAGSKGVLHKGQVARRVGRLESQVSAAQK